jgi:hypothetical protein
MPAFARQLLDALEAALAQQQALPSASIHFEREAPLAADECPALVVEIGEARRTATLGSEAGFDLCALQVELTFSLHTRGAPRTRVADPFVQAINAALMRDWSLGGLAQRLAFQGLRGRATQSDSLVAITDLTYQATCCISERDLALFTH